MSEGEKFICKGVCYTHEDVQQQQSHQFFKSSPNLSNSARNTIFGIRIFNETYRQLKKQNYEYRRQSARSIGYQ